MGIAKVDGLLQSNNEIRKNLLTWNLGTYEQYSKNEDKTRGESYDIRNLRPVSSTLRAGLYDYTYNLDKGLKSEINAQYFYNVPEKETYTVGSVERRGRWNGEYSNYMDYVGEKYGIKPYVMSSLATSVFGENIYSSTANMDWFDMPTSFTSLLSGSITPVLGSSFSIGAIHFTNPYEALNGTIVTNPNGTGDDTKLGKLSNLLYAISMKKGAYQNDLRGSLTKYITPSLYYVYGNNGDNFDKLGKRLIVDNSTGRIPDLYETSFVHISEYGGTQFSNFFGDDADREIMNNSSTFLDEQLLHSKYYNPRSPYVNFLNGDDMHFSILNVDDFRHSEIRKSFGEGTKVYNEGDSTFDVRRNTTVSEKLAIEHPEDVALKTRDDLLEKTNKMFLNHKIETLAGRFHTSKDLDTGLFDNARDKRYGNSHGRNLLKKNPFAKEAEDNNYDNPYCRVWTYHKEYQKIKDFIRPIKGEIKQKDDDKNDGTGSNTTGRLTVAEVQGKLAKNYRSFREGWNSEMSGDQYLANNTVLGNNGFVNIVPFQHNAKVDGVDYSGAQAVKRCMFSIENLAWKDVAYVNSNLSKEQRGPNGGRIMWFPPYDLDFQENVNVEWNSNSFIGRGEKVYSYTNTDRTGTLSFTMLIDHPAIVNSYARMDNGEISNEDILRYFAGCDMPDDNHEFGKNGETKSDGNGSKGNGNGEASTVNPQEGEVRQKKITFYVFFPNNYSGNFNAKREEDYDEKLFEEDSPMDEDWVSYLLYGKNCGVNATSAYNGYEMIANENQGISYNGDDSDTVKGRADSKVKTQRDKLYLHLIKEDESNDPQRVFKYRTDFDLRQVMHIKPSGVRNYEDIHSYGFNTTCPEEYNKETDDEMFISFVDFLNFYVLNSEVNANPRYNEMLKDDRCGNTQSDAINIFRTMKPISVEVNGNATNQDNNNAQALSNRRCKTVLKMMKECYGDIVEDIKQGENKVGKVKKITDNNTREAKLNRFTSVTITFSNGGITDTIGKRAERNDGQYYRIAQDSAETTNSTISYRRYETEAEFFDKINADDSPYSRSLKDKFKYFTPAFHSISPEGFNARLTFLQQCTRQGHTVESTSNGQYIQAAGNLAFGRMPVCVLRIGDFINSRIIINNISINYNNGSGIQWDLNPEGAGVQPMYAKISLGIVLLGGQTLEGPISKLQNAISFNYYPNAGVYDDRADRGHSSFTHLERVTTDEKGNTTVEKLKNSYTWRDRYSYIFEPEQPTKE